ncbi:hypothetical protein FQN54_001734 [Arachnomyces sp. PD_36]|nr:hypothetical protein FQN54_001734 [Arachnomyces sp. PD_36]
MLKIARRTISSISAQIDDNGKDDFRDQASDAELSPEAIEDRERKDLENQIVERWTKVWFGLYQVSDRNGPYHINQIRRLYYGAGMAGYILKQQTPKKGARNLGLLELAISNSNYDADSPVGGIQNLKLFDNLSIQTLKSTLDLLAAYEKEIEPLQEIYTLLRSLQVDLSRTPTQEDEQEVLTRYPPLADPIAERIIHYNSRLAVLCMDVEVEALERYKATQQPAVDEFGVPSKNNPPVGWYVQQRVFPRGKRGGGLFSSSLG